MNETMLPKNLKREKAKTEIEPETYISNFDRLAEITKGRKVDIDPSLKSEITGEFLGRFAQGRKTQSEVVKELIEEYLDVDVCKIVRPHAILSRE